MAFVEMDKFIMWVTCVFMHSAPSFRNLAGMLSNPVLLLTLSFCSSLKTKLSDTGFKNNLHALGFSILCVFHITCSMLNIILQTKRGCSKNLPSTRNN